MVASPGSLKCRIAFQLLFLIIFIGVVAWISSVYSAFATALGCVVDQYYVLKSITQGEVGQNLQSNLAQIPQEAIQALVPLQQLLYGLVVPAAIAWLISFLLIISMCKQVNSGKGICPSACFKCGIFLLIICCLICLILYIIVAAVGAAVQTAAAQDAFNSVDNFCSTELPGARQELEKNQAMLTLLESFNVNTPELEQAKIEADAAKRILDSMALLCPCFTAIYTSMLSFLGRASARRPSRSSSCSSTASTAA